ncbi:MULTISPECIES: DUF4148 domain-containing protein [Paraburkholderia]|uniref:DUF4148 domain-containing protein n=1 Tax=Paraburkholderia largidicola TaxID=3014751 RepID=A0A7I8BT85_9BURK|nr:MULTISPECIES: DUF4148 domain-containing protein [Paraburkholderia]BCF91723.1 hypothetical protein PPGU16_47900 [Paraburkholderia sp. PGU16]CAG9250636.1 conserved exported hypothetical protein [Paraburkholderia caribensis]
MKTSITIAMLTAVLLMPAISYAKIDSNQTTTRGEVKAQIVQAEKDGTLHQSKVHYPDYNANASTVAQQSDSGYGTMPLNFSQSGSPAQGINNSILFDHH